MTFFSNKKQSCLYKLPPLSTQFNSIANEIFDSIFIQTAHPRPSIICPKKKMGSGNLNATEYQKFLDQVQYSKNGVARYEWIFGEGYLSTGGLETTKEIVPELELKSGQKLLDMGSGLGGHDFYMVEKYNVYIDAVDLSQNMMDVAMDYYNKKPHLKDRINFRLCDVTKAEFPNNYYDAIYSRDALLHIKDKKQLFENFMKWLKPGGRIVFTDYLRGNRQPQSEEFLEYVKQRDYTLWTKDEYEQMLKQVGFVNLKIQECKDKFVQSLERELKKLRDGKQEFLSKFSQKDYDDLEQGWMAKIKRAENNDQSWLMAVAFKPK